MNTDQQSSSSWCSSSRPSRHPLRKLCWLLFLHLFDFITDWQLFPALGFRHHITHFFRLIWYLDDVWLTILDLLLPFHYLFFNQLMVNIIFFLLKRLIFKWLWKKRILLSRIFFILALIAQFDKYLLRLNVLSNTVRLSINIHNWFS